MQVLCAACERAPSVVRHLFYAEPCGGAEPAWRRFMRAPSVMILPREL